MVNPAPHASLRAILFLFSSSSALLISCKGGDRELQKLDSPSLSPPGQHPVIWAEKEGERVDHPPHCLSVFTNTPLNRNRPASLCHPDRYPDVGGKIYQNKAEILQVYYYTQWKPGFYVAFLQFLDYASCFFALLHYRSSELSLWTERGSPPFVCSAVVYSKPNFCLPFPLNRRFRFNFFLLVSA